MTTVAVIPVKQLENAKQRLGTMLSATERSELFRAMFKDVLEAATSCDRIDRVIVVTDDSAVTTIARSFGAEVRAEPEQRGLIAAVTESGKALSKEGVSRMVFLPADIPLVTIEELEVVLDGVGLRDVPEFMIVPAHDLGGSNCVVCSPPDCMDFGFGEDSFRRHLAIARSKGIEAAVARLPGIGLDIDTPDDLAEARRQLIDSNACTHTSRFLEESGIADGLERSLTQTGSS